MKLLTTRNSLLKAATCAATLAGFGLAVPALADNPTVISDMLTGCIGPGGNFIHVAAGPNPSKSCPPSFVQKTWNQAGPQGPDGAAGISCWDLNENGVKDISTEDTNRNGTVDVADCRGFLSPLVSEGTGEERTWYGTFAGREQPDHVMKIFSGTEDDYSNAASIGDIKSLDQYVVDPIGDPCGVWYWDTTSNQNSWILKARGLHYSTHHFAAVSVTDIDTSTGESRTTTGFDLCKNACLSESACVGASYAEGAEEENHISCSLIMSHPEGSGFDHKFLTAKFPGFTVGNMNSPSGWLVFGMLSVCPAPQTP